MRLRASPCRGERIVTSDQCPILWPLAPRRQAANHARLQCILLYGAKRHDLPGVRRRSRIFALRSAHAIRKSSRDSVTSIGIHVDSGAGCNQHRSSNGCGDSGTEHDTKRGEQDQFRARSPWSVVSDRRDVDHLYRKAARRAAAGTSGEVSSAGRETGSLRLEATANAYSVASICKLLIISSNSSLALSRRVSVSRIFLRRPSICVSCSSSCLV